MTYGDQTNKIPEGTQNTTQRTEQKMYYKCFQRDERDDNASMKHAKCNTRKRNTEQKRALRNKNIQVLK